MRRLALIAAALGLIAAGPAPDGQALFKDRCGLCHFAHGFGANTLAKRVGPEKSLIETRQDLQPAYIRSAVRSGVGAMPRLTKVELPDSELMAIVAYLTRKHTPGH